MTATDVAADSAILLSVTDGLARVTLNRPQRLNAIDDVAGELWRDIAREVTQRDDVKAVLLDAAGQAFCAGGDVQAMASSEYDAATLSHHADVIHEGHATLRHGAKPIVAAVQGAVAGGGLGFMLCADYIVAADSAFFASRYAAIGLTPDCGVSTLLPEAVGMRRALELTLSDRRLSAEEACEWGLVTEVVPSAQVGARALEVAQGWLSGAAGAFGQARRLLRAAPLRDVQASLDDEARTIGAAFATEDATQRIAAFTAGKKRP
ncbi:enoyl-CoA hydratase/isomerase family protein [Salinibacterium sp. SYSU T00001]|uniref:enoyl-CoA hydratase/isomerase family protein n=1 Tax=Homoserinimonas sedimenticola TaxID=2986805 RepID=UPI002235FFBF|nr:enoyl-CoA hydratase/isomerase family protein [Salinibacterium sedimenticola]MCW4384664.1 enoyl-CoA hydratase/isomerase family protein [Salinibacterium sedimenticola]